MDEGPPAGILRPGPTLHGPTRPHPGEALPPEILADLDAAEAALGGGNFGEARRLSRRTLPIKPSARAYAIVPRSFCREGNLGDAKAQLAHLGAERSRVLRECRAAGVDLE